MEGCAGWPADPVPADPGCPPSRPPTWPALAAGRAVKLLLAQRGRISSIPTLKTVAPATAGPTWLASR